MVDYQWTEDVMEQLGLGIDRALRETVGKMGFVLLVFPPGKPGVSNYLSNCERDMMILALEETVDRLKKKADIPRPIGEA